MRTTYEPNNMYGALERSANSLYAHSRNRGQLSCHGFLPSALFGDVRAPALDTHDMDLMPRVTTAVSDKQVITPTKKDRNGLLV